MQCYCHGRICLTDAHQDSTLVNTASGLKFGRDATDWKWWHNSVQGTLRRFHKEGYVRIVAQLQAQN